MFSLLTLQASLNLNKRRIMEKAIRIIIRALLLVSICFLGYFCVMSIVTPIQFEEERALREKSVIKRLIDQKKEDGSSNFKESHIAAAVAYYVMKNAENKEIKNQIYNKLQEDFNFFNSTHIINNSTC